MALARFDFIQNTVAVGSIGNVEAFLAGGSQPLRIIARRGIVGLNAPQPAIEVHPWSPASLLIMHSDGLISHWNPNDFPELQRDSANVAARHLLTTLGKRDDDATVLIAKNMHG